MVASLPGPLSHRFLPGPRYQHCLPDPSHQTEKLRRSDLPHDRTLRPGQRSSRCRPDPSHQTEKLRRPDLLHDRTLRPLEKSFRLWRPTLLFRLPKDFRQSRLRHPRALRQLLPRQIPQGFQLLPFQTPQSLHQLLPLLSGQSRPDVSLQQGDRPCHFLLTPGLSRPMILQDLIQRHVQHHVLLRRYQKTPRRRPKES